MLLQTITCKVKDFLFKSTQIYRFQIYHKRKSAPAFLGLSIIFPFYSYYIFITILFLSYFHIIIVENILKLNTLNILKSEQETMGPQLITKIENPRPSMNKIS